MSAGIFRIRFAVHAVLFLVLTLVVAACATPLPPMRRAVPITVVEVAARAEHDVDAAYAARLLQALSASVGRASDTVGQEARLLVVVRERHVGTGPFALPGQNVVRADIVLVEPVSGRVIYSGMVRQIAPAVHDVDAALIAALVADIRRLLGLEGLAWHPVAGKKAPVARPQPKPVATDLEAAAVSDPLLNGAITPETPALDPDYDLSKPPAIDITRPLLAPETPTAPTTPTAPGAAAGPAAAPASATAPNRTIAAPPVAPAVKPTETPAAPVATPAAAKPAAPAAPAAASTTGVSTDAAPEPCIVTVDNDCTDPDAQ